MNSKKAKAQHFLQLSSKGKSRQAFELYVASNFRHHNPYFKGDGNTLMIAMEEAAAMNPEKNFEIHRALEDRDLVAVHSRVRRNPDDLGAAVIHIFRFEGERIAELWDFGQAVEALTENENGMF
jgi:predicted SnoaL-like aldol condensation-catalyzing enzyme